jgi:hypothetical protein
VKAYHLRTSEPCEVFSFGYGLELNSIFVPTKNVLVGFVRQNNMSGLIKSYSTVNYCNRAQDIVEGNRNGVEGKIISEFELETKTVNRIGRNGRESKVTTLAEYDGSTDILVKILSGEFVKKGLLCRLLFG